MTTEVQAPTSPSTVAGANLLAGYTEQAVWSKINNISPRTTARYRNLPDGLPWVEFGGKVFIPNGEAAAWLKSRVCRPNQKRRAAR